MRSPFEEGNRTILVAIVVVLLGVLGGSILFIVLRSGDDERSPGHPLSTDIPDPSASPRATARSDDPATRAPGPRRTSSPGARRTDGAPTSPQSGGGGSGPVIVNFQASPARVSCGSAASAPVEARFTLDNAEHWSLRTADESLSDGDFPGVDVNTPTSVELTYPCSRSSLTITLTAEGAGGRSITRRTTVSRG